MKIHIKKEGNNQTHEFHQFTEWSYDTFISKLDRQRNTFGFTSSQANANVNSDINARYRSSIRCSYTIREKIFRCLMVFSFSSTYRYTGFPRLEWFGEFFHARVCSCRTLQLIRFTHIHIYIILSCEKKIARNIEVINILNFGNEFS